MLAALPGLISAGMTIGGTLFGMNEAENAAERAKAAAQEAARAHALGLTQSIEERQNGTNRSLGYLSYLDPFRTGGANANGLLSNALGMNGVDAQRGYFQNFQTDPGYQATLKGGTDAIEQSQAGAGLLRSGGTLKSIQDYGSRLMGSMFSDRLNRLAGIGAQGQQAATAQMGLGASVEQSGSQDVASYLAQRGAANAGGIMNASNADQRGTQNVLSMLGYGMGQIKPAVNDMFGKFIGGGGGFNLGNVPGLGNFKAGY